MARYFSTSTLGFLKELKRNNNREWFADNKARFEKDVKEAMLHFISDFSSHLRKISPAFIADPKPTGGSLFRIHKDIRFSKDKTPYKTHMGAHFFHRDCGKDTQAPGFYFHLEPGDSLGGGGLWRPQSSLLRKVRDKIVHDPKAWKSTVSKCGEITGEKLTKAPRGVDPEHPLIEALKLKDYLVTISFTDKEICSDDFMKIYVEACKKAAPLVEFLTKAAALSWR